MYEANHETSHVIVDCLVKLMQNPTIEQHFRYNTANYCNLYSKILQSINSYNLLKEYVDKNVIGKNLISSQDFLNNFLDIVFPILAKCSITHQDMFVVFSQIIQKVCIFYMFLTNHFSINFCFSVFFTTIKNCLVHI